MKYSLFTAFYRVIRYLLIGGSNKRTGGLIWRRRYRDMTVSQACSILRGECARRILFLRGFAVRTYSIMEDDFFWYYKKEEFPCNVTTEEAKTDPCRYPQKLGLTCIRIDLLRESNAYRA